MTAGKREVVDAELLEAEFKSKWEVLCDAAHKATKPSILETPFAKTTAAQIVLIEVKNSLARQGVDGFLIDALMDLSNAIDEVRSGRSSSLLEPQRKPQGGRPIRPLGEAYLMGMASAAIRLAKRGTTLDVTSRAARILGLSRPELEHHYKALTRAEGPSKITHVAEQSLFSAVVRGDQSFKDIARGYDIEIADDGYPTAEQVLQCLERLVRDWRLKRV